ncbi:MAG: carboxypeptidase-like regulatory domain-containing protein [Proteobacteria bacterium]|nr:carboxypeptidase-like regulatory domain-containing protein [Pseudomonadota bacterium]
MLHPCATCRRHVNVDEATCPFCGAHVASVTPRPALLAGRLSRAAIFAGATLASGCYVVPDPQYAPPPPPPPPNDTQQVQQPPDPTPPPDDGTRTFAQPPAAAGSIRGVLRHADGRVAISVTIELHGAGASTSTLTDGAGEYAFTNLVAGTYSLTYPNDGGGNPRMPPTGVRSVLATGTTAQLDLYMTAPQPERTFDRSGPCCKPYGAPPPAAAWSEPHARRTLRRGRAPTRLVRARHSGRQARALHCSIT